MTWPTPQPELVIRYAYLWNREALSGQEEGRKDRPCAVVLTRQDVASGIRVYVLQITHSAPASAADGVEIPALTKARLGLDAERSWVGVTEANVFTLPGPDLRFASGKGPESTVYGFLPPRLFRAVLDRFLSADKKARANIVKRTE